jgi:hypothetical protein
LQEKVPNHLPLLQAKAVVVSREGKGPARPGQVTSEKKNESESPLLTEKPQGGRPGWAIDRGV